MTQPTPPATGPSPEPESWDVHFASRHFRALFGMASGLALLALTIRHLIVGDTLLWPEVVLYVLLFVGMVLCVFPWATAKEAIGLLLDHVPGLRATSSEGHGE